MATAPTRKTTLNRLPERGHFDSETIYGILDAMPMCQVAYIFEGRPAIVPTLQWREGNHVYWHGSTGANSHLHGKQNDVCMNVAIFDGLVLARSAFHHSANYRSVSIFGTPIQITDHDEKLAKLKTFVDGLYPGRWEQLRPIKDKEIRATSLLSLPISEASAKLRNGPPSDEQEDYAFDVWAGVMPLQMRFGEALADEFTASETPVPEYVRRESFE